MPMKQGLSSAQQISSGKGWLLGLPGTLGLKKNLGNWCLHPLEFHPEYSLAVTQLLGASQFDLWLYDL